MERTSTRTKRRWKMTRMIKDRVMSCEHEKEKKRKQTRKQKMGMRKDKGLEV